MLHNKKRMTRLLLPMITALLFTHSAASLQVGEINVNSTLGEPFNANFAVQHPTSLNSQELIIRQASLEIYQQMGVDTAMLYQDLRFTLLDNGQVSVKSRGPIKEPFLNFVVQFVWPEGEMVREFTVLLDPS